MSETAIKKLEELSGKTSVQLGAVLVIFVALAGLVYAAGQQSEKLRGAIDDTQGLKACYTQTGKDLQVHATDIAVMKEAINVQKEVSKDILEGVKECRFEIKQLGKK